MKFTRHLLQEILESAVFSFLNILFVTGDLAVMIYALVNEKIILSNGSHTFRRSVDPFLDPFLERSGDEDGDSHQDGESLARIDMVEIFFCFLFALLNALELLAFSTSFRKHLHRHLLALADTALLIIILTCIFTHRVPLLKVVAGTIRFIFAIVHLIYCIVELELKKLEKEVEHMMDKKLVGVVVGGGKRDAPEGAEGQGEEKDEETAAKEVEFGLEEATAHAQDDTIARKSVARKSTPTVPKKISPKPKPSNSGSAIAPTLSSPQNGQFKAPAPAQAMYTPAISGLPPQYQIYQANGQTFIVPTSGGVPFSMTPNQTPMLSLLNGEPSGGLNWTQPGTQQPQLGPIFLQNATFPMQAQAPSQPETASTTLSQPQGPSLSSESKNDPQTIITLSPDSSPPTPKPEIPTNSGIATATPSHKSVGTGVSRKSARKRAAQKLESTRKEEKEIAKPEVTSSLSAPSEWTVDQVYQFILSLSGCSETANQFLDQEIDGQGLVLLTVDQLITFLGIKLGPALKIAGKIAQLSKQAANSEG